MKKKKLKQTNAERQCPLSSVQVQDPWTQFLFLKFIKSVGWQHWDDDTYRGLLAFQYTGDRATELTVVVARPVTANMTAVRRNHDQHWQQQQQQQRVVRDGDDVIVDQSTDTGCSVCTALRASERECTGSRQQSIGAGGRRATVRGPTSVLTSWQRGLVELGSTLWRQWLL